VEVEVAVTQAGPAEPETQPEAAGLQPMVTVEELTLEQTPVEVEESAQ
jgi:hypothetical protein